MPSFSGWTSRIRGRLGTSSLEAWADYIPENCPTEPTPLLSHVSLLDFIALSLHFLPGLVVVSICWMLCLLAAVFVSILLTLWVMSAGASAASSTDVSPWASGLDGWKARRLYCYLPQPCDDASLTLLEGRSSLKFETLEVDDVRSGPY